MKYLILRAAIPTLIVAIISAVISISIKGTAGLLGSILGSLIVVIFFTIGQVMLNRVLENNPTMAMSAAMVIYLVKIAVLFGLLLAFKNATVFDTKIFAISVLACTLVWTIAEVWAFGTEKVLYVQPDSKPKNL